MPPDEQSRPSRKSLLSKFSGWALVAFNLGAAVLSLLAFWDLRTSSDPGAAIGMVMVLLLWAAGNVILGPLALFAGIRDARSRKNPRKEQR